jgi:phosphatidate cytidylyltransferase
MRIVTTILLYCLSTLIIIYSSNDLFNLITFIIMMIASIELLNILHIFNKIYKIIYILLLLISSIFFMKIPDIICYIDILWWLIAIILISSISKSIFIWKNKILILFISYIIFDSFIISIISLSEKNRLLILYIILLISSADIGAFIFGKYIGKKQIASFISPNKSLEGCIGGICTAIICNIIFLNYYMYYYFINYYMYIIIMNIILVIISIYGDLFESLLKRHANIKDSGKILPGHGGVLDRIDSLLPTLPFYYVFIKIFNIY